MAEPMGVDLLPYRPNVGVVLINGDGRIFAGQRRDSDSPAWQMPQGGIDEDEDPYAAAVRELQEETGIVSISLLAEAPGWLTYDLPPDVAMEAWKGRYRGQTQKWFAFRFNGDESEINILAPAGVHKPEFDAWKWVPINQITSLIIPFKRAVYEQVVDIFGPFCTR